MAIHTPASHHHYFHTSPPGRQPARTTASTVRLLGGEPSGRGGHPPVARKAANSIRQDMTVSAWKHTDTIGRSSGPHRAHKKNIYITYGLYTHVYAEVSLMIYKTYGLHMYRYAYMRITS